MKESARITHGYKCSLLSLGLLLILINVLGFLAIVVCFLADRVGNVASVRAAHRLLGEKTGAAIADAKL